MTREHKSFDYDYEKNAITRGGVSYRLDELSGGDRMHLMMRGLAVYLYAQDDPHAAFKAAVDGTKPIKPVKGQLRANNASLWREAAAIVGARAAVKFRPAVGKKLENTAEFQAELVKARQKAAGWSKDQYAKAQQNPAVVAEFNALTGASDEDFKALFSDEAVAPPLGLAEAAD